MRAITRLVGGVTLAAAAATAFAVPAGAVTTHSSSQPARGANHAVFVQTQGLSGNDVVVYDRAPDGTLHWAHTYGTGGVGGQLTGSVVDHTASQGSLTYDARHALLYAVNAGSNTVSVFAVRGDRLHLIQVVRSGGTFPVSVTAWGDQVFVLNAENGGSIQGYVATDYGLILAKEWHRALGLDPNATPQFTHTPGQVLFSPTGRQLVVTTKANTNAVLVYGIGHFGQLSQYPVVNSLPGTVPFGVTFDPSGYLVVAETGTNSLATFTLPTSGHLVSRSVVATGQAATCWVAPAGSYLYASNAGSPSLTGFRADSHGTLTDLGNTTTDAGTVDASSTDGGRLLYVQAGGAGNVDGFWVNADGSLTAIGSVLVPGAAGGEGIVAS